ncbi:MAG: metallophosphoesterase [Prevotella sp.]|nr:metallophosphoesterase [Prevotella sp.]
MIARIVFLLLAVLLFSQLYIDRRRLRKKPMWVRVLRWLPTLAMMVWTVRLALERSFVPEDMTETNTYLLLFCLIFVPKAIYTLCGGLGRLVKRLFHSRYNWGNLIGLFFGFWAFYIVAYGSFIGVSRLEVKEVEIAVKGLPKAFNGYRMVLFSDAHVGSMEGWRQKYLERDIDVINAQKADAIVFAGDLQNLRPSELYPVQDKLRLLKAPDGVFAVLGNHDYSAYINDDPAICAANEKDTQNRMRQFGWTLLMNEHRVLTRDGQRLVIGGMENGTGNSKVARGDVKKTLEGVKDDDCVIMIEHDPAVWRESILKEADIPLTLSGHTHGGQLSLFGIGTSTITQKEIHGLYDDGKDHQLYVTCGLGGLVPFRFGVTPEIVVITLVSK